MPERQSRGGQSRGDDGRDAGSRRTGIPGQGGGDSRFEDRARPALETAGDLDPRRGVLVLLSDASRVAEAGEVEGAQGKAEESGQGRAQPESLEESFKPVLGLDLPFEGKAVEDASVQSIEVARGGLFMALESDRPAQGCKGIAIVIRMHADSNSNSPTNKPATAGVRRIDAT